MNHPFDVLKTEYSQLLSIMTVKPECSSRVNSIASKILGYRSRFEDVSKINGVPLLLMGPSFYREATLDFSKNPAQGWPLTSRSKDVPRNGPFPDWKTAAVAAYHLNGLDKIGAGKWTWELICFYAEAFNGFGYRDNHRMHSPYLWGGTNIQTVGKYTSDGKFDPTEWDPQIGIIPVARRLVDLSTDLALDTAIPAPTPSGLAISSDPKHGVSWLQEALRELGFDVSVDGSYGRITKASVLEFQSAYGLKQDGYAGPQTLAALDRAVLALRSSSKPEVVSGAPEKAA